MRTVTSEDDSKCLHIGLVNNMPDSAVEATERQFEELLWNAADGFRVNLSLFEIPELCRSQQTRLRMKASYRSVAELWNYSLDGLIVTGAEPKTRDIVNEPFWGTLAQLIDWAGENTLSSVWSCLAAHAAVRRIDSIERHLFSQKLFGVFECTKHSDNPLTSGLPLLCQIPHSRWNDVAANALSGCDYRILTRLSDGRVDAFIKRRRNLFVFFQGHPEYATDSLLLEYRRDIRRFIRFEAEVYPSLPEGYFDTESAATLRAIQERATIQRSEEFLAELLAVLGPKRVPNTWRSTALRIYRNWLTYLFEEKEKAQRSRAPRVSFGLPRSFVDDYIPLSNKAGVG